MWSSATRFVKRYPVESALAVALAVLVVLAVLRRRREGWQFEGRVKDLSDKHRKRIYQICRDGGNLGVAQQNEVYKYLAKYEKAVAEAECKKGYQDYTVSRRQNTVNQLLKREQAKCRHGECSSASLRASRPCFNAAQTKCCNEQQKKCVPVQTGDYRDGIDKKNAEYIKARRKGEVKGTEGDCTYYSRVMLPDGKWVCPDGASIDTGLNWGSSNTKYDTYQCTSTKTCAKKANDLAKPGGGSGSQPAAANADAPPNCGPGKTPCAEGAYMCVANTCGCYIDDGKVFRGQANCVDDGRAAKLEKCLKEATCRPRDTACVPEEKQRVCRTQFG